MNKWPQVDACGNGQPQCTAVMATTRHAVLIESNAGVVVDILLIVEGCKGFPSKEPDNVGILGVAAVLVSHLVELRAAVVHLVAAVEVGRDHPVNCCVIR